MSKAPPALDNAVRALAQRGWQWSIQRSLIAVFALIPIGVVLSLVAVVTGLPGMAGSFVAYGVLVWVVVWVGRQAAADGGGWGTAFGWQRPIWMDAASATLGLLVAYLVRTIALVLLVAVYPTLRDEEVSNIDLSGRTTAYLIAAGVLTIVVAPPIEELIFRGMLLRAGMLRYGFWLSAIGSSLLFGGLHAGQGGSVAEAVAIFVSISAFGFALCGIARYTGRLAPCVAVHMCSNALAFGIALS